jgi:hypothetical protein
MQMQVKNVKTAILAGLLLMLTGCASDQAPLPEMPFESAAVLSTDKDTYREGEKIKVNFSNSPGNEGDWICIVPAGTPDTDADDYQYMPQGLGQGFLTFNAPSPGKYEARAYYNYGRNGYVVSGRHAFSVVSAGDVASPAAATGKATRDDYQLFQTVIFGGANLPPAGLSTAGSLAVLKTSGGSSVDYELWTQERVSPNAPGQKKEIIYGPVRFSRNPTSEEVSFSTGGFDLTEEVINQIMKQVEKNPRMEGTWNQEISLKLLRTHLPRKLAFHFDVQKIVLPPGVPALLIRTYSDVFKIDLFPTAMSADNGSFSGMYKGVLVYSPEDHRMYQMASAFDALKGDETLQVQETAFLAGLDGKPVFPLLDIRKTLDLQKQDKPGPLTSMPPWALQALKVQQVVSLASSTTAERASNPFSLVSIGQGLSELSTIDSLSGVLGGYSSGDLIEAYASTYGEPAAQEATRFMGNLVNTGVSELLPKSAMLAPLGPVPAVLLTAYSVYTIYDNMAQLSTLVYYDQVLGKLEPFQWPQCKPMECIAQANQAFDLAEPIEPVPDPGPPPDPAAPGMARWVVPTVIGGAAVAAGLAVGLSGGDGDESSSSSVSDECAASFNQVYSCGTGNPTMVGFIVPTRCGNCPSGSYNGGTDTVTSGGPYYQCICN